MKTSRAALIAAGLAVLSLVLFVPGLIAALDPRLLNPEGKGIGAVSSWGVPLAFLAFATGVGAMIEIGLAHGRQTGHGFAVIAVMVPIAQVLIILWVGVNAGRKVLSPRMSCGTNLSGIGRAMLLYSNDYEDALPVAGAKGTVWGASLGDWTAQDRSAAFGLRPDGTGGQATIASSLYLLVKYTEVTPKTFVCRGERGTRPFDPNEHLPGRTKLAALWDFGPDPSRHCSYSYDMPYGTYRRTISAEPAMAVAADHNPWIDGLFWKATNFSKFRPAGTDKQQRMGNAVAHALQGQNVLFLDTHVEFQKRPYCSLDDDNIYTSWDGIDKTRGKPPKLGSQPADARDSLLVNDPPASRK
ncbi:MAG: hypothetical protein M1376_12310 [Planctomycetes bacterium]|nr:hypothetical protein [Planctomycetota bacterium]